MKSTLVFVGNIEKVTNYVLYEPYFLGNVRMRKYKIESEVCKKQAILIKVSDEEYVDIDKLDSILDLLLIKLELLKGRKLLLLTQQKPQCKDKIYIGKINPFCDPNKIISFHQLKKIRHNI